MGSAATLTVDTNGGGDAIPLKKQWILLMQEILSGFHQENTLKTQM
ncbi:MAG: hypothetical protein R2741_10510 [Methanolobus sp.]